MYSVLMEVRLRPDSTIILQARRLFVGQTMKLVGGGKKYNMGMLCRHMTVTQVARDQGYGPSVKCCNLHLDMHWSKCR